MKILGVLLALLVHCTAHAGSAYLAIPESRTIESCQARLSIDGRIVAHMRWVLEFDRDKAHAQFTPGDSPGWYVDTVRAWIDSAYEWQGDPRAWFETEWGACEASDT